MSVNDEKTFWKPTFLEILIVGAVCVAIVVFVGSVLLGDVPAENIAPASPAPIGA